MQKLKHDILVVAGPTASGKSTLGMCLAQRLNGEIICADSVQVYKHLDIGTAKPTQNDRESVPHHVLDFLELTDSYSAAQFQTDANAAIEDIKSRGRLPVVVGGTGLYISAVLYPMAFTEAERDDAYRAQLQPLDSDTLHDMLKHADPVTAARLHKNDRVRMIRALEVAHISGKPFSGHVVDYKAQTPRYKAFVTAPDMPREALYSRINRRVIEMMNMGWQQELRDILDTGCDPFLRPLQTLGYKQIGAYFRGECDEDELIPAIQRETRRFAKRQLTWFRALTNIHWVDVHTQSMDDVIEDIIRRL